ncbi:prephenate-dependent tRNA uridine(34) hydroxylase TrhP [Atopomonas sediminilitoris]|uniref:prephenate-dependent tRNA uridine(34) hydroxylase TrhP n=1 Tax=Atopomonas sediminilitoris TaxID=2919919 RepID=UPI001F4ECA1A|nr:tRNA 5-hydroxyuridine modification protein YegQ [Atopomonas sediminilitoris]
MEYAFAYGADAIYCGLPRWSLRVRNNDFDIEHLAQGLERARSLNKQVYVACNIAPHNSKIRTLQRDLAPVAELKPDALIVSDPGVAMLVREAWPDLPLHLSVQANAVNYAAVKFWGKQGISRVILSRELSLEEIEDIRAECPEMEIEVFVHGALCIAYSGRCLLSGYMNRRDPNQGTCTNACRWGYDIKPGEESPEGEIRSSASLYVIEEKNRPGELMPIEEDEHGTYILNSKDLRAVHHVERLARAGVHSLKIEGRTKSHYYVARTAQVYRQAIDDAAAGKAFDRSLMDDLEKLANRGYTEGFLRRHVHDEYQNYQHGASQTDLAQFVGEVFDYDPSRGLQVNVKNRFALGDTLELMTPTGRLRWQLSALLNKSGQAIDVAPGDGHRVWLPITLPEHLLPQLALGLLTREVPRNLAHSGQDCSGCSMA